MQQNQKGAREEILGTHLQNKQMSHRAIGKLLCIADSTVSNVLKNFRKRLNIDHKAGAGLRPGPVSKENVQKVVQAFRKNPN